MSSQFQPYLKSICAVYEQRSHFYTQTDAEGRETVFDLMVETAEEKTWDDRDRPKKREKIERLPVLEGLQKYAPNHVLLVGRPGSGKSMALEQLLLELAKESQQDAALPIPVLVQLKADRPILPLICETVQRHRLRLKEDELNDLLFDSKLLLLLDGVNEIPQEALRQNLQQFRDDNLNVPMAFTTRDLELGGTLGIEKKLKMQPLTTEQLKEFVRKYLPGQGEALLRRLNDRLKELAETPLLLKMLCDVFRLEGELPRSRGALFRTFDQKYEEIKGTVPVSADFRRFKSELLQHLAFGMLAGDALEPRLRLSKSEAEQRLEEFLAGRVNAPGQAAREWLENLLKHHLLQVADNPKEVEFHHQLFLEYYAAEALLIRVARLNDEQLKREFLNYLKWTEPLALMLALMEDEAQALRVVKLALDVDQQLGARLAGEVKPAFQEKTVGFVNALEAADWLKRRLLKETRSNYAIPGLFKLTKHPDSDVRVGATAALGKIGSEMAIPDLLNLLEDSDRIVRANAAAALGEIGSEIAIPRLLDLLKDSDFGIRWSAATALGEIGSEAAVTSLLELLEDDHPDVRRAAVAALSEIGSESTIASLLKSCKNSRFISATEALVRIGSEDVVAGLLNLLEESNFGVHIEAVKALGKIGSESAIPSLLNLLNLLNPLTDAEFSLYGGIDAVEALGKIGSESAIPSLLNLLNRPKDSAFSSRIRVTAVEALSKIGSGKVTDILLNLLEDSDRRVRVTAAAALGKIGTETPIPDLLELMQHSDSSVRMRAAATLGKIGAEEAIPDLLKLMECCSYGHLSDVCEAAAVSLSNIGSETAIPGLCKLLEDSDSYGCQRVIEVLGKIGSERATAVLLNLLKRSDLFMYASVLEALGDIGSEAAIDGLLEQLEHPNLFIRKTAAEALGRIRSERVTSILLKLMTNPDSDVRVEAAYALGKNGSEAAIAVLLKLLKHRFFIPEEAASALRVIAKQHTVMIAQHLPHLLTLIPTDSGEDAYRVILTIQENCKYYSYKVFQAYLEAQKNDRPTSQESDRSLTTINNYPNVTEVKQTIMSNLSKYNFPAAQKVQIFEQVTTYIENNHPTDSEVKTAIADLTLLLTQLQTQHPQVTTESQALTVLDAEFTEIRQSTTHPFVTLRQQLLNPERHLQAIKATFAEVAKHYLEESVWSKAVVTYLDKLSETPDQGA